MHLHLVYAREISINGTKYAGVSFLVFNALLIAFCTATKLLLLKCANLDVKSVYAFLLLELVKVAWQVVAMLVIVAQNVLVMGSMLLGVTTAKIIERRSKKSKVHKIPKITTNACKA